METANDRIPSHDDLDDTPQRPTRETLFRILSIFAFQWRFLAVAAVTSFAVALLWLAEPLLVSLIIDRAILEGNPQLLIVFTGLMVAVALVVLLLEVLKSYCFALVSERVVRSVRIMLFESLQEQSHRFYVGMSSGTVSSRMWNDTAGVQAAVSVALIELLGTVVLLFSTLVFMLIWNWALTLLCLSVTPLVLGLSVYLGKRNQEITRKLLATLEVLVAFAFERLSINGFILLNAFGYDKRRDSKRFEDGATELLRLSLWQSLTVQSTHIVLVIFPIVASAIIYLYGGARVIDGELSLGTVTAFLALSAMLTAHVSSLASLNVNVMGSLAPFQRIFAWLDLKPEIEEADDAVALSRFHGHVAFRNVSFEYEAGRPVLRDVSFDVRPGQLLALVGPSGAGKTTVTHLILRFYDPTSGSVEVDGLDLRSVRLSSLREATSLVSQENIVFNTTFRENLLVAKPEASEQEMIAACKAAQLHEHIEGLPSGYDCTVGEFGYRLSGGERQRLAIARAVLKRATILIMDEPSASLDSITERSIREALSPLLEESSAIVIAHRLSTILEADKILVLDDGRIVDAGRHDELVARCELYRRLYQEQFAAQGSERLD